MAILQFDATRVAPAKQITITLGKSKAEYRWAERRSLSFDELAAMLGSAQIGVKDGPCYTPATFSGTFRRLDQAVQIDVVVLDSDCGHDIGEIERAIKARGWRAIVHSTFSHLSPLTTIAAGAYDKWLAETPGGDVASYMVAKKGYLPRILEDAVIEDESRDGASRTYLIRHQPCPKFRIVLPLDTPWVAEDFESQTIANAVWKERIGALASALGLFHDQSCVDTSRLFYLPRIAAGQQFICRVIQGQDIDLWGLAEARSEPAMPLLAQVATSKPHEVTDHIMWRNGAEWLNLTEWAARYAHRFEIQTAIRARSPGVFGSRRSGVKQHLTCPNASEHVTGAEDQTGTFVVNASQFTAAGMPHLKPGFIVHCSHNGCANRDRLTHIRAMLDAGTLTAGDLTDPKFLIADIPAVDAGALLGERPATVNTGNIPTSLISALPGVMGAMHDYIVTTGLRPQPTLALGATLAFMASAIGQRVQLQHWHTRPNVYVLGVAHSGAGKERAFSAIKQMARSAGQTSKLIGVEEMVSDAGIVASVFQKPNQIMLIDEISFLFASTSSKNAQAHTTNIIGTLLKLYSSSHTQYQSKSYADTDKVKIIDQPCVSLYGCSTKDGLFASLTSRDIRSGLLSRAVLFDAGDHDPRSNPPTAKPVPSQVTDWLTAWGKINPIQNIVAREGGEPVIEPRTVMMTAEAQEIAMAFEAEMHDAKQASRAGGTDALYVRALENALKFALIRACAVPPVKTESGPTVDQSALRVDAETIRWAIELSRATVKRMEECARSEIADNPFDEKAKALRNAIRNAGVKGMSKRDIIRHRSGRWAEKDLESIVKLLAEAEDIFYVPDCRKGRGQPRNAYFHRDFMREDFLAQLEESENSCTTQPPVVR